MTMKSGYRAADTIGHATCMAHASYCRQIAAKYPPGSEWRVLYAENAREWLRLAKYYRPQPRSWTPRLAA